VYDHWPFFIIDIKTPYMNVLERWRRWWYAEEVDGIDLDGFHLEERREIRRYHKQQAFTETADLATTGGTVRGHVTFVGKYVGDVLVKEGAYLILRGEIEGKLTIERRAKVVIFGTVRRGVKAARAFWIKSGARVHGEVHTRGFSREPNAVMDGTVNMYDKSDRSTPFQGKFEDEVWIMKEPLDLS
jgi:cytoskeletal protein CcmA (bactofilin family)